jgi:Na+/phosphate symporter
MDMTFSGGKEPSADLLKETEVLYREVAEELALAMRGVRQGETGEAKAAIQAVKDLRTAFQMVMDERTRVEKLRKQVAGVVRDYALDFDAARDEIGRRLARLREAGGGG